MSKKPRSKSASAKRGALREVDGIFVDREHLDQASSALVKAGFQYSAVLERSTNGGRRIAVKDLPGGDRTQADKRQARTLSTSLTGAITTLVAVGVTIASGGAAVAAVAAAALVGGSAATGVRYLQNYGRI